MFDGVADQFHHLIASSEASPPSLALSSSSLPPHHLPFTFSHLASTPPISTTNVIATTIFPDFDLYPPPSSSQQHPHPHPLNIQQPISEFLHRPLQHHHQLPHSTTPRTLQKDEEKPNDDDDELACMRLLPPPGGEDRSWTDEEVLALVRIRSGVENWFPEVAWEHVSRKLEELGFERSAEKCKEKFEEGSRFFDSNNDDGDDNGYSKNNYRILSELEEICHADHGRKPCDPNIESNENEMEGHAEEKEGGTARIRDSENRGCGNEDAMRVKGRAKRKRRRQKFEMFKRFCEEVVEKLMIQQEEMHNKLLEDLVKRDEEMVVRDEEWKKREMDRINKELDARANEQAIAGDRQATVIELLKKFSSSMLDHKILCPIGESGEEGNGQSFPSIPSNNCGISTSAQPPPTEFGDLDPKGKDAKTAAVADKRIPQTAKDSPSVRKDRSPDFPEVPATAKVNDQEVVSKRWPRDEVQALINLRSGIDDREKADHNRHSGSHGDAPLWERISRGMKELGYMRSAKRCKEKWENINKYFRKTRDVRKKRSADSKTCPYFQQLSSLYGQDRVVPPSPSASPGGRRCT